MAVERTIRLAIALGREPMRRWERDAITAALRVEGVVLVGCTQEETQRADRAALRPGWLFAKHLARLAASDGLLRVAEAPDELGMTRSRDQQALPDVILCLCGEIGAHVQRPRDAEVWAFRNADTVPPNPIPPGIRESFLGAPSSHFELFDLTTERTLRTGFFRTRTEDPAACAEQILEEACTWPAQVLSYMISGTLQERPRSDGPNDAIPFPGLRTMLAFHLKRLTGREGARRNPALDGEWNIGMLHQPIHQLLNEESSLNVRWLPSPSRGKARLEPFGYVDGHGELNVLYRKTDLGTGDSAIARVRPKPDNILKRSRIMLDADGAHAYPYTILIEGQVHVLCSSFTQGRTDLFGVNGANDALEHRSTILGKALHAPTLFQHNNRWWLMGTADADGDTSLFVFHAAAPQGPFSAVGAGAVKCDVRSARPAGTPFVHEGTLYRPSFDASDPHAPSVVLNKVTRLDLDGFAEEAVRRIDGFSATAYGRGVRTLSAMGDVTLVDGLRSPIVKAKQANGSRGKKRHRSRSKDDEA